VLCCHSLRHPRRSERPVTHAGQPTTAPSPVGQAEGRWDVWPVPNHRAPTPWVRAAARVRARGPQPSRAGAPPLTHAVPRPAPPPPQTRRRCRGVNATAGSGRVRPAHACRTSRARPPPRQPSSPCPCPAPLVTASVRSPPRSTAFVVTNRHRLCLRGCGCRCGRYSARVHGAPQPWRARGVRQRAGCVHPTRPRLPCHTCRGYPLP